MGSIKIKGFLTACLCFTLSALCYQSARAQTFAEWFSQGKTQIKYLTQQIAALQAFESSMKQGYNMLHSEWSTIGNFKNGEFGLHQNYYAALNTVNPLVKGNTNIRAIATEQQTIISQLYAIQKLQDLEPGEQSYIVNVTQNLIAECNKDLDALQAILKDGTLQMSDDERLKQLEKLQANMLDKYQFTQSFCNAVRLMVAQRNQEINQTQSLKQLYEIN